jgi:hypothetical protein
MIAKLRLITNATKIEEAYEALERWYEVEPEQDEPDERGRKPRIPKPKFDYAPMLMDPNGVKIAYQEGDVIQVKHSDSADWLPIKNEAAIWNEIQKQLCSPKVGGFGEKKCQNT